MLRESLKEDRKQERKGKVLSIKETQSFVENSIQKKTFKYAKNYISDTFLILMYTIGSNFYGNRPYINHKRTMC